VSWRVRSNTQAVRNPLNSTVLLAALLAVTGAAAGDEIPLSALDLGAASQSYGNPRANKTVDGHPLVLGGRTFDHGFGTHANSRLVLDLKGSARRFTAWVGVDDETKGGGSVEFRVIANGKTLWSSGVMCGKQSAKEVGLFNLGEDEQPVWIRWRELEMNGPLHVRDLWRQKDLEAQSDGFRASVPRHGVMPIKVTGKGGQGN
jgi:NPCBM/NEW2 domain/Alpha galactosidase C-terminal beta sandwich domain